MKRITKDQLCTSFSVLNPPVMRVRPEENFIMETNDRFYLYEGDASSPEAMEILKTMTGPVYVEGVNPGDTLKIEILDIVAPLDYGWILAAQEYGFLGDRVPAFRKTRVQITPDGVIFNGDSILPLRLMIGAIGLAPGDGTLPGTSKGDFGGSMGNTRIGKGASVYLPVFHEGGLLTIGNCHAAAGDGETTASAVECAVDATMRATIDKRFTVNRPVVETDDEVMTTGEGETMEAATRMAVDAMADLLVRHLDIDDTDAAMLIAGAVDVRAGNIGLVPCTMQASVPRSLLSW